MTKTEALYQYFSGFGLSTFVESSVYDLDGAPQFPYLTYEVRTDNFNETDSFITASLWYRSTSWNAIDKKTEAISAFIGTGNVIHIDDGYLLITRGSPFAQSLGDPSDKMIKRKLLNFRIRFYTNS